MEKRIALLIIYNHRYDKNISRLEKIYKDKFPYRFHVIPFYDGNDDIEGDIVPVVGHSWYFQGYICQAYQYIIMKYGVDFFTHYYVIADDMMINPRLCEVNLLQELGLEEDEDFFPELIQLQTLVYPWRIYYALKYRLSLRGVEIKKEIPTIEEAKKRFDKYGIRYDRIPLRVVFSKNISFKDNLKNLFLNGYWKFLIPKKRDLEYPILGGYSDTFIVTKASMPRFMHYCAAFASSGLFVELAIPTAIVLVSDKIKFFKDIKYTRGDLWNEESMAFLNDYNHKLNKLMDNYPENCMYLHPIKLSAWE